MVRGSIAQDLVRLHNKYGSVVRIAPNEVSFISGETAWQDIYGTRCAVLSKGFFISDVLSGFHHGPQKQKVGPFLKDKVWYRPTLNGVRSIVGADPEAHSHMRRALSHAFSDRAIKDQEPIVQRYIDLLINHVRKTIAAEEDGNVVDVKLYNWLTIDIIGYLTFGQSFGCLETATESELGTLVFVLVAGCAGPVVSALVRKYGKRPIYLFASVMSVVGSIIGSTTTSYRQLLASKIIQGFAITAYEAIVVSMVGDLYYIYQRGIFVALFSFTSSTCPNLGSLITGPIAANLGWKYLFHIFTAFSAVQLVLTVLFVPETAYKRDHRYDIDELAVQDLEGLARRDKTHRQKKSQQEKPTPQTQSIDHLERGRGEEGDQALSCTNTSLNVPPPKTFLQEMSFLTETYSDENLLQLIIAPFVVCSNLAILWMVLVSSYVVTAPVLKYPTPAGVIL